MLVDITALLERRQTLPTDVCLAVQARHVVASGDAFDGSLASRTVLDVARTRPLLEEPLLLLVAVHT